MSSKQSFSLDLYNLQEDCMTIYFKRVLIVEESGRFFLTPQWKNSKMLLIVFEENLAAANGQFVRLVIVIVIGKFL